MQLLSVEDVEKILDETQEAVEYQQVSYSCILIPLTVVFGWLYLYCVR